MKKQTYKPNKIRFIAKMMLLVILISTTFSMSSCLVKGKVNRSFFFNSHGEFLEFVEKYNSKNDGDVFTFVSLDFDDSDIVNLYSCKLGTTGEVIHSYVTEYRKFVELYDKNHSENNGFAFKATFYLSDPSLSRNLSNNEYQIKFYYCIKDYNFYQNDEIVMDLVGCYHIDDCTYGFDGLDSYYGIRYYDRDCFADERTFQDHGAYYETYYDLIYMYDINVNGENIARVEIASQTAISAEKLGEICQLLLDNLVIINTEG